MACRKISAPPQEPPSIQALLDKIKANDALIDRSSPHSLSRNTAQVRAVIAELHKSFAASQNLEALARNLGLQFQLNDYLFRLLFARRNDEAFKLALRVQAKAMRLFKTRQKIIALKNYIDEQTSQNDEQTSQKQGASRRGRREGKAEAAEKNIDNHSVPSAETQRPLRDVKERSYAEMDGRKTPGASRENETTATVAEIHRPENGRGQAESFPKFSKAWSALEPRQRLARRHQGTGKVSERIALRFISITKGTEYLLLRPRLWRKNRDGGQDSVPFNFKILSASW